MTVVVCKPVANVRPGEALLCVVQPAAVESWRGAAQGYAACGLSEPVLSIERRGAWAVLITVQRGEDPRRARAARREQVFDAAFMAFVLTDKADSHSGDADPALLPTGPAVAPPVPGRPSSPGQHPRLQGPRPRSLFEEVGDGR